MKEAAEIARELVSILEVWEPKLKSLPAEVISLRKNIQNRTIKQILGHLIDSTSNNIHRFVHLQNLKSPLTFPNYASERNNDRWIAIQNYQEEDWLQMICHLKYSVFHLCHVINNVDDTKLDNQWIAGPDRLISLREMIPYYLSHFRLHLSEIDELINSDGQQINSQ